MAMAISSKPSMLKDYLLDDFGSCSSSGFRSFPRRQCCVAVRSLIEVDLRCGSRSSSKISCAIRKASTTIMKLLPFKSPAARKSFLPRSFSRGIGRRRLLKKEVSADERSRDYEIERWISSGKAAAAAVERKNLMNAESMTVTITSASSSNGDSWSESDSDFTLTCSSFDGNGVVRGKMSSSADTDSKRCRLTVTAAHESMEPPTTKNNWSEGEEENCSPVSVLNSFLEDNDEAGSCSPLTLRLNHFNGTTEKLMQKLRRFESRLSLTAYPYDDSPLPSSEHNPLHKANETEEVAANHLLKLIKAKSSVYEAHELRMDALLVDFFLEGLAKGKERRRDDVEERLMKEAGDWVTGNRPDEVALGWKVKEKRKVYAKDMEEDGIWRSNDADKEEVVVQLEAQVYACLVDEMLDEMMLL